MKRTKSSLLSDYIAIAKKLGVFPNKQECNDNKLSYTTVRRHFETLETLHREAIGTLPKGDPLLDPENALQGKLERFRAKQRASSSLKYEKLFLNNTSFLKLVEKYTDGVFSGRILANKIKKTNKPVERVNNLILSDLHIGSDINKEETGATDYKAVEEARKLASVVLQTSQYKQDHRDTTELNVFILGDIINGLLHDDRQGAILAEQTCRAIHLLIQAVAYLSDNFNKVNVLCVTGNHGRNKARHQERAIHQKHDSIETIIYYAVQKACVKLSNVSFHIPINQWGTCVVLGHKFGFTHGDTILKTGNPSSTLKVASLEAAVNKINASLKDTDEYRVVIYGHHHRPHVVHLDSGVCLIGNGSIQPPDSFIHSLGVFENINGQWLFETTKEFAVGDMRLIYVPTSVDDDAELDKIITPWKTYS